MGLIEKDLSEPYSIFTYRYFIINWPRLCFLVPQDTPQLWYLSAWWQAMDGDKCIGCVVNKLEMHAGSGAMRGYIAMLAVDKSYRKLKIGASAQRTV